MSWRHVFERDLLSLSRSRILSSVLSFTVLLTVLPLWLLNPPSSSELALPLFILVFGSLMVALALLERPRLIAGIAVLSTGIFIVLGLSTSSGIPIRPDRTNTLIQAIGAGFSILIPFFGLLTSYGAIVGERTTGSVRFLLGLPNSREDAYIGKFLSRGSVVIGSVVVGSGLVSIALLVDIGVESFATMAGLGLITIPFAVIFVGIGMVASTLADTEIHAVAIAIGTYIIFRIAWPALQSLLVEGAFGPRRFTQAYFWVGRINPLNAYAKSISLLLSGQNPNSPLITTPPQQIAPIAQSTEFAVMVLLTWATLVPVVGFVIFKNRDIL